jgi:hypothetical protein
MFTARSPLQLRKVLVFTANAKRLVYGAQWRIAHTFEH